MSSLSESAFAKINLTLRVTGRRADGYHLLDSVIAFADIADRLQAEPADDITLEIHGPFAHAAPKDRNTVLTAAIKLRERYRVAEGASIRLEKNLPAGAGIGGGSADAGACLRLLCRLWGLAPEAGELEALALAIGADVPVCLASQPTRLRGIGELLTPGPDLAGTPILLIHPGTPLSTPDVFRAFRGPFSAADDAMDVASGHNDLEAPACRLLPEISAVLAALRGQAGCRLARMSGSGSACFGLFDAGDAAMVAQSALSTRHPGWWVRAGHLLEGSLLCRNATSSVTRARETSFRR